MKIQPTSPTVHANLFSQIGTPALFSLMYAGRFCQSSGSAGSFTWYKAKSLSLVIHMANGNEYGNFHHTFIIYARGAMTVDTKGLRANPYCAAPRAVAVSASEGRAITLMREPNCACLPRFNRHWSKKGKTWTRTSTLLKRYSLPEKPPTSNKASRG